jgi:hypothetical protein
LPFDWASVGTVFSGSLERLKNDGTGGFIPPFLQAKAVVVESESYGKHGGLLKIALTFSYGNTVRWVRVTHTPPYKLVELPLSSTIIHIDTISVN